MWTRRTYGPPPGSVRLEPLTDEEVGRSKTTDERQGNTGSRQPGEAFLEPVVQGWRSWNLSSHLTLKARGRPERCCLPTPGAWPDCRLLLRASLPTGPPASSSPSTTSTQPPRYQQTAGAGPPQAPRTPTRRRPGRPTTPTEADATTRTSTKAAPMPRPLVAIRRTPTCGTTWKRPGSATATSATGTSATRRSPPRHPTWPPRPT